MLLVYREAEMTLLIVTKCHSRASIMLHRATKNCSMPCCATRVLIVLHAESCYVCAKYISASLVLYRVVSCANKTVIDYLLREEITIFAIISVLK